MTPLEQPRFCTEPEPAPLPLDLSTWLDRRALAHLAVRIALTVEEDQLVPVASPETDGRVPPRSLVAVLVYFYAVGIFSSQAIEEQMDQDEGFPLPGGNELPDGQALRRFRRLNRSVIQACLEEVLGWASQWASLGWAPGCSTDPGRGVTSAAWGLPLPAPAGAILPDLRPPIVQEATNRLNRAVHLDSMALDE